MSNDLTKNDLKLSKGRAEGVGYFSKLVVLYQDEDADDVVVEKVFGSGSVVPDWRAPDISFWLQCGSVATPQHRQRDDRQPPLLRQENVACVA